MSIQDQHSEDQIITTLRHEFPIFKKQANPFVYFDQAATSLKPLCVINAITKYYTDYTANVHRGIYKNSLRSEEAYEEVRTKIAKFIGAPHHKEIIFTSGATASINHFAYSFCQKYLNPGDRIILSTMEHHGSIVCWQHMAKMFSLTLEFITLTPTGELDLNNFESLLSPPTKLLSILSVSNTLGTINPLKLLAKKCHENNVIIFVDGAQSVSHFPTNVQELDIDFFCFSGHKLFGPTGVGVLWGKEKLLETLPPFFYGGGIVQQVNLKSSEFLNIPHCFEAGTPPIAQVIGLGAAIDFIQSIGWNTIQKIENQNKRLAEIVFKKYKDSVQLYGTSSDKVDIFSFLVKGIHPHDVGTFLSEMGIAIRTGHLCTQPITTHFNIIALSRISTSIYNLSSDWQYFDQVLEKILEFFNIY